MALGSGLSSNRFLKPSSNIQIRATNIKGNPNPNPNPSPSPSFQVPHVKRCLRCGTSYQDKDNSPTACLFHGHTTGERGLFALAPPHQGIDGEWSDGSGVIVYKWNEKGNRPNTGQANWKRRWSCCAEYDEKASPCRRGWHVSYDDGFTLF
ncbi:hypothetical protein MRB53_006941 [Persea americana]|uniref:Uncharacterized protein n=1 Tax=Persea americana TaxID=3435 RepID=A0ACC2MIJ7_PERAE|nr:hypothetical protein MRB53_006941 [Persea americana]|eukprot:TRINITY_DN10597_c3_g1_i1.p1 TRINITY_DN10597_c3_g1~~TRINITY_DN10597_c3_g1_i1.p1  ORF type:complete len:151 (-),score=30.91 TRINITY_DN10597_c3_g1_i1:227-679(-)